MVDGSATILRRVRIRQAIQSDLPAMEWGGEFIHFRRLFADTYRLYEQGEVMMWIAEIPDEGLVGQLFVSLKSNRPELADGRGRAYIYGFRIRPPYRNQGLGALMVKTVEKDLSHRGFRKVTLNVAHENLSARRLYERLGYRIVGYEPGNWWYLDDQGHRKDVHEPAWRMEKDL